ncbi:50S ribosomal protein L32 [Phaeobacter gallaeciensis]|uniref:50S ribosomal protein L32 n=1 Tax=Phaeobacter gallaeciensis TaxID=60890 RepID=UPI003B967975
MDGDTGAARGGLSVARRRCRRNHVARGPPNLSADPQCRAVGNAGQLWRSAG